MMEVRGIPSDKLIKRSRKQEYYFDTDCSPFLIEDPQYGILRIPDARPLSQAVQTTDTLMLDFIEKCLEMDPELRFTAEEALQHPFILAAESDSHLDFYGGQQDQSNEGASVLVNGTSFKSMTEDQSSASLLK